MADRDRDDEDYEVGYGKPPKHSRFPPGQSGNPKGRRKGSRGLKSDLEAELNAVHTITNSKDGSKMKDRQQRLAIKTLCRRAALGDLKAQGILFPLILQIFGVEDRGEGRAKLSAPDQAILDALLAERAADSPLAALADEDPSTSDNDDQRPTEGGDDHG